MKSKSFNLGVEWHAFSTTYHDNYFKQRWLCATRLRNTLRLDQSEIVVWEGVTGFKGMWALFAFDKYAVLLKEFFAENMYTCSLNSKGVLKSTA